MGILRAAWVTFLFPAWLAGGQVRGVVMDARGGEPLARVRIQLVGSGLAATTDDQGRFQIDGVKAGDYVLHVETVGYRLEKRGFQISEPETKDFEVVLSPDTFRRTDTVEVKAGPFDVAPVAAPSELSLSGSEIKNLGTVLVDDPLRAVQNLPGVVSNNDFYSQFSVRGAAYSNIGFYLDDVLLHSPFHTVQNLSDGASLSIFNSDILEQVALLPSAFPSRFGDRTGAALDVHTREGSRTRPSFRAAGSVANASLLAEGPLTRSGRGSWLATARKSYLQYIIQRTSNDPSSLGFGYRDVQTKLTYDLTRGQTISLHVLDGQSDYDRSRARSRAGVNSLIDGLFHVSLAKANWRYTPSERVLLSATAAYMRERFENLNRDNRPLAVGYYGEWVGNGQFTWLWKGSNALEAGWSGRRLRDDGFANSYLNNSDTVRVLDRFRGNAVRYGGYAQQSWSTAGNRLRFAAGLRWDRHELVDTGAVSPQASLAVQLRSSTQLQLGWGHYAQFPELQLLLLPAGGARLIPERAIHYVAALEQRIGPQSRIRIEAYERQDRDVIARPLLEPRLMDGRVVFPATTPLFHNSVRGYARGIMVMAQRRSANRLSGWVSYSLGYARQRDGVESGSFWSLQDQRHTFNTYLGYRLKPSVNLSGKWMYGSGVPIAGFVQRAPNDTYLVSGTRNRENIDPYHRVDLRVNKSVTRDRWKLTLYAEVINVTNHQNLRLSSFDGVNTRTGQAFLTFERVLPILPSGGIMVEF